MGDSVFASNVLGFDDRGKVKLSMRVVDQATGEDISEKVGQPRAAGRDEVGYSRRAPNGRACSLLVLFFKKIKEGTGFLKKDCKN